MNPVPSGATDLNINSPPSSDLTEAGDPGRWKPYFGGAQFHRGNRTSSGWTTASPSRGTGDAVLTSYPNARFLAACRATQAKGYTVWVIGFGTSVTSQMTECSSGGRAYLSNNAAELTATFRFITSQVADLRLNE